MGEAVKRGRRPDPSKDEAILQAANDLFLERGYSVSIDDIATAANVSKQTVYARFPSKEVLFETVVRAGAEELVGVLFAAGKPAALAEALIALGMRYQEIVLDPRRVSMQRLLISQAQQFPDLARRFFEVGPGYVRERIAEFMRAESEKGRLAVDDAEEAAVHFLGLIKGADQLAALMGLADVGDAARRRQKVERAVEAFLKIYGV